MKDIDFDELDRAVNTVIGGKSAEPVSKPVEVAPLEETVEDKPVFEPVTVEAPVEPLAPAVAPAARRSGNSGRFMDVMHPSSDMRTRSERPVMQPITTSSVQDSPVEPEQSKDEIYDWQKPLESPFLPDAQVEKRPLGGGLNTSDIGSEEFKFEGILDEPKEELLEAPDDPRLEATTMPDPIDFAAAAFKEPIEDETPSETVMAEVEAVEDQKPALEEAQVDEEPITEKPAPIEYQEPVGPTSITQQYTEKQTTHLDSGAIFDTESYHQPVVQPLKKKSSLWIILWIILLVVLGAAAGWAVYTFVLPLL